jgi:sporulation protein YlmC with PRC-barrel domain
MADRDNPDFLSASTIKGDKVVNAAGDNIGKIEELMVDLDNGRVAYAVLSFGGFLGMGDKLFSIPWQALKLRLHDHAFLLDIPKDILERAEGFDKDNWPLTREELSRSYTYYGYQTYWQTGATEQIELPGKTEQERTTRRVSMEGRENPDFLSTGTIKGDKVLNRAGDNIGKIEELMIDLEDGKVGYVVVSHGGLLGIGSKLFSIPWQALKLRAHEHAFLLDVPKETLDKAEGFDKDRWPLTRIELSKTYTYYGYQPYWLTGAAAAAGISTGMVGETESERMARMERKRQKEMPGETAERMARMEREKQAAMPEERKAERVTWTETEKQGVVETEEERKARLERERLEGLRGTQEDRISQLEKQRMEAQKKAEAERDRLAQLERERMEAERQARAEREKLAKLEKELQEARRQEETEKVTRLEKELSEVQTHEETHREKLSQLERACAEAQKQAVTEKGTLAKLEKERIEAERLAKTQRERIAQLESERAEAERMPPTAKVSGREIPELLSADSIKTDRVVNTAGEDLGRIEELMIDLDSGRVAYAVMSFGGFLGMSDKLFAIPWQALKLRAHEHAFTLDIPRNVLEKAEGFDKERWPLTREELSRSYTYYGYQPYWQTGVEGEMGMLKGAESERMTREERVRQGRLETAEEVMARQEKETIEGLEKKETDKEKLARLERDKIIAEKREHKYGK